MLLKITPNLISKMRTANKMFTQPALRHGSAADTCVWSSRSCLSSKASHLTFNSPSALSGKRNYTSIGTHTFLLPAFPSRVFFLLIEVSCSSQRSVSHHSGSSQAGSVSTPLRACTAWHRKVFLVTGVSGKTK